MKVEVFGRSDDLIEVEGVMLSDEFGDYEKSYLHFGDGTILEVEYGPRDDPDYFWRIKVRKTGSGTTITRSDGTYADEGKCDKLTLEGDLRSVHCWGDITGPTEDDFVGFIESVDFVELSQDQMKRIIAICEEP